MERRTKIQNKEVIIKTISDADNSVFEEIFTDREYNILDEKIKDAASLIVDIGAHIGCFSVYASILNPKTKILAFEPDENNYKLLKENLQLNNAKNVQSKNLAVTSKEEVRIINVSEDSHNHSFYNTENKISERKIQTTTLQKILKNDARVDVVKIDCEGSEFEILRNLSEEDFEKIKTIYIEFHEFDESMRRSELKTILEKNGFQTRISESRYDKRFGFILAENRKYGESTFS